MVIYSKDPKQAFGEKIKQMKNNP